VARYSSTLNRFVRGDSITPVASAARTANGDSGWLDSDDFHAAVFLLNITVVGNDANETLDVVVETASSAAGANTRAVTGSPFAQKTQPGGVTSERKSFGGFDSFYRVRWTVGGTTPAFTFSVSGDAK
jgi:hypothetical protein